ncbi:hypothetical protein JTE90_002284 [Oedothorax gibbosus]|uniref:Uncharacterized protein n=1 Tax=Oedothorax gibbosus TaxID=931172 RepID=A0AAV6U8I1_9ARAC|nr:hypothetical protein JTE90_002284 [Oedothorax gibbosus]
MTQANDYSIIDVATILAEGKNFLQPNTSNQTILMSKDLILILILNKVARVRMFEMKVDQGKNGRETRYEGEGRTSTGFKDRRKERGEIECLVLVLFFVFRLEPETPLLLAILYASISFAQLRKDAPTPSLRLLRLRNHRILSDMLIW